LLKTLPENGGSLGAQVTGKLTQPDCGFNNEDFKPDIFTDNYICMTLTYAPNCRVKMWR